ncbi:magnesium chelatase subunit D [Roseicella frigidaeris]|uniref:Magnesium chelatase subunit D n=1 Tax=Roseicella frigidaeris TaxID=2230885 RepID=A0A327MBW3_9PROT|nr:magnesium chelatase subunit D [Roseicella frigidaeris]RAI57678.1 magnesium chelatase subunit D [Roseicella frigidaeris]
MTTAPPKVAPGAAPETGAEAALVAALLALDPVGLGGVALRGPPGPAREAWLALLRRLLPREAPWRRVPPGVADGRLLGGLDLPGTLQAGRRIAERGLLAEADGGVLLLAMAERLPAATALRLAAALDTGEVRVERDGLALCQPARLGLVALDEGLEEERPPVALLDRLAFHLTLDGAPPDAAAPASLRAARARLRRLPPPAPAVIEALCATAVALGIASLRAPLLALRAAQAAAALAGRRAVEAADAALAARLVLAPRATRLPAPEEAAEEEEAAEARPPEATPEAAPGEAAAQTLPDVVLAAARAALPPELLAHLAAAAPVAGAGAGGEGRKGPARQAARRGRPVGTRAGDPRAGFRLSLVETLRAAAPWQRLRGAGGAGARIAVRREDFRVLRLRRPAETTTVFVVDASGSAALHRLAEAKGAAELLLAACYARRDRVALISFRGSGAELLLPPTRSLVRARRCLAALPGGGGTPLALGLEAARALAATERRQGRTPLLVLLTDGRANISREGRAAGRAQAEADALAAGRALRREGCAGAVLLVDMAPRPQAFARDLAEALGAPHLPLPAADPALLSAAVQRTAARLVAGHGAAA